MCSKIRRDQYVQSKLNDRAHIAQSQRRRLDEDTASILSTSASKGSKLSQDW